MVFRAPIVCAICLRYLFALSPSHFAGFPMFSNQKNLFPRTASRRGLSFFEFTGCLFAVIVGAVLGAMYLGIDVKGVALSVLEKTELIEPTSASAAEAADVQDTLATTNENSTTSQSQSPETQPEDSQQPVAEQTWQETITSAVNEHLPPEIPLEEQQELTKVHWNQLLSLIDESQQAAAQASQFSGPPQLFDVLASRKQVHVDALEQMEELDPHGVHARVVSYSAAIKQWHEDGEKLYRRAMDLLTDTAKAELSGPFAQSWQSAATQHRMEERLLKDRRSALENFVEHWLNETE